MDHAEARQCVPAIAGRLPLPVPAQEQALGEPGQAARFIAPFDDAGSAREGWLAGLRRESFVPHYQFLGQQDLLDTPE